MFEVGQGVRVWHRCKTAQALDLFPPLWRFAFLKMLNLRGVILRTASFSIAVDPIAKGAVVHHISQEVLRTCTQLMPRSLSLFSHGLARIKNDTSHIGELQMVTWASRKFCSGCKQFSDLARNVTYAFIRGTQREYSSKPLKHEC